MRKYALMVIVVGVALASPAARAQTTPSSQAAAAPSTREVDPGVFNTTPVIDRPELRAGRLEIRPGGTRRVHQHDDVQFHLFIPLTGSIQLTVGSQTVDAVAGQVYFVARGTPHGFKNTSASTATAVEVFIKPQTAAGGGASYGDTLAAALAAVSGAATPSSVSRFPAGTRSR